MLLCLASGSSTVGIAVRAEPAGVAPTLDSPEAELLRLW
jgi:hypothetical protein